MSWRRKGKIWKINEELRVRYKKISMEVRVKQRNFKVRGVKWLR